MKVAVVTLVLTPPVDSTVVASRELTFNPSPIDPPNPRIVPANAVTTDVRFPNGTSVSGAMTDVSSGGIRSAPVSFHVDATVPVVVPPPSAPVVSGVVGVDVPDAVVPPQAEAAPAA